MNSVSVPIFNFVLIMCCHDTLPTVSVHFYLRGAGSLGAGVAGLGLAPEVLCEGDLEESR